MVRFSLPYGLCPLLNSIILIIVCYCLRNEVAISAWAHNSELHALFSAGRFGNKIFQQMAVSLLAEKYDLRASYLRVEEFAELGVPLYNGKKLMKGDDVELTDDLLFKLLTANGSGELTGRLRVNGFYQSPWFSQYLRAVFRGKYFTSLHRANPWRERVGANNDTFVHVRLGDMADIRTRLASDFIKAIGSPAGRVYIASDSLDHDIIRELVTYLNATLLDNWSIVRTIQFGSTCAYIVLSDGSFSWTIGSMASNSSRVRIVPRDLNWSGNITQPDWQIF